MTGDRINAMNLGDCDEHFLSYVVLKSPHDLFDGEPRKWYEHDEEMLKASLEHPGVVFVLDGDGEEPGDIWRTFYRNGGKAEWRPVISRPDFSEELFETLADQG